MMDIEQEEAFRGNLNYLGYAEVRSMLARRIWNEEKVAIAEVWLADQDDLRSAADQSESMKISRSAKNAAWAAAIAAIVAVPIAIAALIVSLLTG